MGPAGPPSTATIQADPIAPFTGSVFHVYGSGFAPGSTVLMRMDYLKSAGSARFETSVVVGPYGTFRVPIALVSETASGTYQVEALVDGLLRATAPIYVR